MTIVVVVCVIGVFAAYWLHPFCFFCWGVFGIFLSPVLERVVDYVVVYAVVVCLVLWW